MAPLPALAGGLGDGAVALGEFRHHHGLRHEVDAVSAPLLRHRRRAESEFGAFSDDLPIESLARTGNLIALQRDGTYLFLRKLPRLQLPRALFFVQRKIHAVPAVRRPLAADI